MSLYDFPFLLRICDSKNLLSALHGSRRWLSVYLSSFTTRKLFLDHTKKTERLPELLTKDISLVADLIDLLFLGVEVLLSYRVSRVFSTFVGPWTTTVNLAGSIIPELSGGNHLKNNFPLTSYLPSCSVVWGSEKFMSSIYLLKCLTLSSC